MSKFAYKSIFKLNTLGPKNFKFSHTHTEREKERPLQISYTIINIARYTY